MSGIKAWGVQFALWLQFSWPFARDVLWPVLRDGRIHCDEVVDKIRERWPRDERGSYVDLVLPWAAWTQPRRQDRGEA